ncbi:MAG TPA: OmpA family protein [Verrucomicrobiae bacterium]|jgi:chemotaxis protein MotB|nr:OmpA family protein [Verrucomicrobiae bacterium]
MPKETWMIAAGLTIALLVGLLSFSSYDKKVRLEQAQAELASTRDLADKNAAEAAALKDKLTSSEERCQELEKEKQAVEKNHQSLEDEMKAALESKDVTISQLQGKLTVNILDRIMFDSGEAELKPDGEAVLRKLAAVLDQHTNLMIHVVGHTDNVPIRPGARSRFASNWELSTARATAAVRFLSEKAGVDPRRLGAVGYGEFKPIADNSTSEGRAKNRRIAITILPEQMAPAEPAAAVASLNAAPPLLAGATNSVARSAAAATPDTDSPAR